MPFVLGRALDMTAIPGGQAKNDTIDAPKIAVLLHGGMPPRAYASPAKIGPPDKDQGRAVGRSMDLHRTAQESPPRPDRANG
jgi:hypothetical protein